MENNLDNFHANIGMDKHRGVEAMSQKHIESYVRLMVRREECRRKIEFN